MATIPELLDGHVTLEVECLDRLYLNGYIGKLATGPGLVFFMRDQLGKPIPSPVILGQISEKFREAVKALAEQEGVPVYQFRHKAVPFRRKTSTPLPHCRCSKTTPGKDYPQNLMLDPRQGFLLRAPRF